MNPALRDQLIILVRQLLLMVGTALGLQTILAPESLLVSALAQQIVSVGILVVPLVYAQLAARFSRKKLLQALATSGKLSEHQIELLVKDPLTYTPPISTPKDQTPI